MQRLHANDVSGIALALKLGYDHLCLPMEFEASRRCVVIADAAKVVKTLGKFPLPIEVVAFGHAKTQARICDAFAECDLGIAPRLRIISRLKFSTKSRFWLSSGCSNFNARTRPSRSAR